MCDAWHNSVLCGVCFFFFFKQKTAYEMLRSLVGSEMCIRDRHNNAAELAARAKVRKRDVSLQTITDEGTRANDTFMTIVQTAKKLSVSAVSYTHLRAHETPEHLVCRLLLEKKKNK